MPTNPYTVVLDFEERIAEWAGAPYAIAVESGTAAIFLSLMFRRATQGSIGSVAIPTHTYPSVPCSILHAGGTVQWTSAPWQGIYTLVPLNIIDGALRFRPQMYEIPGSLHCLSFHIKKLLPIGRGGMVLTDDPSARDWLRKARFDGRDPLPLQQDNFTMLGWNMYMEPSQAARGIQLLEIIRRQSSFPDLSVESQGYPDLSQYKVYNVGY